MSLKLKFIVSILVLVTTIMVSIMDYQMLVIDDLHATQLIPKYAKEHNLHPTPVIALTANAVKVEVEHYLVKGMDDYLTKQFTITRCKTYCKSG